MHRKSLFKNIREAQNLFHLEEFTRAFNLLGEIEKNTSHLHLKSKIANLKVQCLFQVGNIQTAKEYIEDLLTKYPLSGQMTFLAASVYRKLGEHVKASRLFLRCVCLYPDNTQYALVYAQFLKETNRLAESNGIIFKSLKENRRNKLHDSGLYFLYLELGLNYYQLNNFSRALVLLNYSQKNIKNFPFYDLIAEIYLKRNQFKSAYKNITMHIKNWGEGDPDALFTYAKTLVSLNRKKEALKQLEKCAQIWGEVVVTPGDMTYLFPLMQDGSLKEVHNLILEL
ncbi:MAG: tetratricopeptide repeat protein [Spirochaetia bacterium]|nr:tetratricopeptide repeat protein [Spirochaetia bacterium]